MKGVGVSLDHWPVKNLTSHTMKVRLKCRRKDSGLVNVPWTQSAGVKKMVSLSLSPFFPGSASYLRDIRGRPLVKGRLASWKPFLSRVRLWRLESLCSPAVQTTSCSRWSRYVYDRCKLLK